MPPAPTDSRYSVLRRLASGGMADVYLAVLRGAEGFEKQTIVKRIRDGLADDEDYRRMFVEEARLMAPLAHANVVSVLDFGESEGGFFIALEYIDGLDLAKLLKRVGKLPPPMASYICGCVLQGLAYVHTRAGPDGRQLHIVHRDVSPSNVFLGRNGDVKVGDFGVAKVINAAVQTLPGTVKGKLAYMAPEQASAAEVDGRADVYSVGVMLFELLIGTRPFSEGTDRRQPDEDAPDVRSLDPAVPPALAAVVRTALSFDRDSRFHSAEEMARALAAAAQGPLPGPTDVARLVAEHAPSAPRAGQADPFAAALGLGDETGASATVAARGRSTRPLRWPPAVGLALVGAVVALVGVAYLGNRHESPDPVAPTPSAAPTPPAAPTPTAAPTPDAAPLPTAAPRVTQGPRKSGRAAKGAKALLDVNSTPWAKVYVDGTYLGDTPLRGLSLDPGRHQLRLVNPTRQRSFETSLDLAAGEQRVLPVDLEAGVVTAAP